MAATNQKLVLYFDPDHAPTKKKVKNCLIRLSPENDDRVDSLLKQGRVVLKRNADPEKERRIIELLAKAGGVCHFESVGSPPTQDQHVASAPENMVCPKCKRAQKMAEECIHCGVIITKAKQQTLPKRPRPTDPLFPSASSGKAVESKSHIRDVFKKRCGPSFEKAWRWLSGNPLGGEKVQQWYRRLGDALSRCAVVFLVTLALEVGLLYLSRVVWFIYTSTSVGQVYLAKFGNDANGIVHLMQSNVAIVGWQAAAVAFGVCILLGVAAQWFHLIGFLYLPFGFLGHTIIWGLPLTGISAWLLYQQDITITMNTSCAVTILPSLLLLPCGLQLVQTVVPEMGAVLRIGKRAAGGWDAHIDQMKYTIRAWWNQISNS